MSLPRDSSWDGIYNSFQKSATVDNPFPANYFKWLNKHGYDDKKPRGPQMEVRFEAFSWMGDVAADVLSGTPNKVKFFANHVGCTANQNCRSSEQQRLSARSLGLRPILINHGKGEWKGNHRAGWSVDAEYDFNEQAGKHGIAGWGYLDDHELWVKVRDKVPPFSKGKVSIGELSRKSIVESGKKNVVGGIIYELSLLTDDVLPGDSEGYVQAIETWSPVMEQNWEIKLSESQSTGGSLTNPPSDPLANTKAVIREAVWTTAFINNLPDSAFAKIDSGGTKDSEGKTTPRSLRHYPHHGTTGTIDLPHLRNANARASQQSDEAAARHLDDHKKDMKVGQFAEKKEDQEAWVQLEEKAIESSVIEEELYALTSRVAALEPIVTAKAEEMVNAIVERHDLGKILNIFGPRFVKMEASLDTHGERIVELEKCAGAIKTGVNTSQVSRSDAEAFLRKFEGIFGTPIHLEHLPPQVGRNYLRDAILAERNRIKSQIENLR